MDTVEQILKACTVEGNIVKLPSGQLEKKLYDNVAKALNKIGGRWKGGKIGGFVFEEDPCYLLNQIAEGTKVNIKKEFQFYETPPALADRLVELANIDSPDLLVLEPSAGRGAIAKAILKKEPGLIVHCYELMELNRSYLARIPDTVILGYDFIQASDSTRFDRIIANPPFSNNQDIEHITKMYVNLKKGGRLVTIVSQHWQVSTNRTETEFGKWLNAVNAEVVNLERGAFKKSGANFDSAIIIIDK